MPTIKMKKGYPTSDGVMHDKHADAVKSQVKINMSEALDAEANVDVDGLIDTLQFIMDNAEVVSDYITHFCQKPKPAAKKKSAKK